MAYRDYHYREIITKAICGKGRNRIKEFNNVFPSHQPSSILGCWIINHHYHAKKKSKDCVEIHGSYDINIWYSFNENTKTEVVTETVQYCDEVVLSEMDKHSFGNPDEIIAKVIQQPNCLQCKIDEQGNGITVEVEREFAVSVIGETKVTVKVEPEQHTSFEKNHSHYKPDSKGSYVKGKGL